MKFDLLAPVRLKKTPDLDRYRLSDGALMRDYQLRAAHKIFTGEPVRDPLTGAKTGKDRDGIAIHVDPGLGKTIMALTAISEWYNWGIIKKGVLVVAPIKVCETVWRQEAREWSHTKHLKFELIRGTEKTRAFAISRPAHVHLVNPEMLTWLQRHVRADWGAYWDALIIDESSMFKDSRTKRFRVLSNYGTKRAQRDASGDVLKDLTGHHIVVGPHRFKRTAVLTGTPNPSGLQNLWAPFYLLDHGARLHSHFETFQGRYFHKTQQVAPHVFKQELNKDEDEVRPLWQVKQGGPERIHELVADITIELNANDYNVLPEQLPAFKHYIELPEALKPHYRRLEREAVFEMLNHPVLAANGGAKSLMCWQLCNGAIYTTDDYGKQSWEEVHTAKLDKLVELVNELDKHCLIPYHFNHDLERITRRFKAEGIPYAVLKGKHTGEIINRWNRKEIPNLLIHPQSAGHGINLQFGGHTLIWFSTIWSLERYLQTNCRLARSGQKEIVAVHVIMARNTTDDVRFNSLLEHGDDMERFRKAVLAYQKQIGMDIDAMPHIPTGKGFGGIKL